MCHTGGDIAMLNPNLGNIPDNKMLAIWCQIGSRLDQILTTKP